MLASIARSAGATLRAVLLAAVLALPARARAEPPAAPPAPASPPAAPVPNAALAPAKPAASNEPAEPDPKTVTERAQRGVVVLVRAGRPLALGIVLRGDGRILTALSPLTHGNNVTARFADGTTVGVRVGHSDRGTDLALLVPERLHLADAGLRASRREAKAGSVLQSFAATWNGPARPTRVTIKHVQTALGGDGQRLFGALEPTAPLRAVDYGAPLLDEGGDVVAVVARACPDEPNRACRPMGFGVPTGMLKAFLRATKPGAAPPQPWLGVRVSRSRTGSGVMVRAVHPHGPAARAGIRAARDGGGDVIVAVDGQPVATPKSFYQAVLEHAVGDRLVILLLSGDRYREVVVSTVSAPPRRSHRLKRPRKMPGTRPGTPAPDRGQK